MSSVSMRAMPSEGSRSRKCSSISPPPPASFSGRGSVTFTYSMFMTPWLISAARGERISVSPLGVG